MPKTESMRDLLVIWEFKGSYPDVPIAEGVDYNALIEGDASPVFVTVPIGQVNATSGNKNYYSADFVTELERQVLANKPIGIFGHIRQEDLATAFPAEAVHWVGAKRVGELLWGKGYVPPGDARNRLQRYKATGTKIATSIFAEAERVWDDTVKAFRVVAETLKLGQIDIAPADRAGIAALAAIPLLTSEMQDSPATEPEQEIVMDKYEVIRELKAEDAKLLPDAVVEAILAKVPQPETPAEVQLVTELREALGVDEKADLAKLVTELRQAEQQRKAEAVSRRISELAADPEKGVKLESVRGLVTELVAARNPQTVEEAETAYQSVIEMESVKAALSAQVQATMGPAQHKPTPARAEGHRYFNIPSRKEPA